jgi:hypothetical protein
MPGLHRPGQFPDRAAGRPADIALSPKRWAKSQGEGPEEQNATSKSRRSPCRKGDADLEAAEPERAAVADGPAAAFRCLSAAQPGGRSRRSFRHSRARKSAGKASSGRERESGAVQIAKSGSWDGHEIGLIGGQNHAKVGVTTSGSRHFAIFGDLNSRAPSTR